MGAAIRPGDTAPATAPEATGPPARGACLFLIAQGSDLAAPPARLGLAAVDEVHLVRGPRRALTARGGVARHYELALADPRISSHHARLARIQGRWLIEDRGSRNGTFVNGLRVEQAALVDGDLLEVGQTLLSFRDGLAPTEPTLVTVDPAAPPGMTSLLPAVQRDLDQLKAAARTGVTVLLEGETGTGKEVVARAIHALSGRRGDLVAINCGGLPRERVAAELFGWKRGAFPGASADHLGLIRAADGGTLFLDEIGDLPPGDQAILLRVLQEREVTPIAATRPIAVDLRVVAATHQPLDALAARDGFRADLLARLSGFRATLPPLRARREDLGLLLAALLARRSPEVRAVTMHILALRALATHAWPANVRELEHALAHALMRRPDGGAIEVDHLPASVTAGPPRASTRTAEPGSRDDLIERLRFHRGNVAAIARELGKARMQIHRWLKRHDLDPEQFRG